MRPALRIAAIRAPARPGSDPEPRLRPNRRHDPVLRPHPGAPIELTRIIPPGTAANVYLPSVPGLANGAYAMVVTADRPIAALARTDWEATRAAGHLLERRAGHDRRAAAGRGRATTAGTSIVSIQNTDAAATQVVHVEALGMNRVAARVAVDRSVTRSAITIDFERDADFSPLRSAAAHGFLGWMKVTSGAEGRGPVVHRRHDQPAGRCTRSRACRSASWPTT
ncbi:MAG: hypothetical protein U0470_03965 [Anaerolineae bacterium]